LHVVAGSRETRGNPVSVETDILNLFFEIWGQNHDDQRKEHCLKDRSGDVYSVHVLRLVNRIERVDTKQAERRKRQYDIILVSSGSAHNSDNRVAS